MKRKFVKISSDEHYKLVKYIKKENSFEYNKDNGIEKITSDSGNVFVMAFNAKWNIYHVMTITKSDNNDSLNELNNLIIKSDEV